MSAPSASALTAAKAIIELFQLLDESDITPHNLAQLIDQAMGLPAPDKVILKAMREWFSETSGYFSDVYGDTAAVIDGTYNLELLATHVAAALAKAKAK